MDFYIFWKFGFCRTPPSLRQLFYPLVNLLIPPSLPSHPSPFPIYPTHPSSLTLLLFKYPPTLHSRSSSHIIHSFPLFPPFTYPQLIHKLLTGYPQLFHNPLPYSSTFYLPQYPHFYCYFSNHPHYNSYSIPIQSYPQVH